MKKAFEQNVSRARPRVRLGIPFGESETDGASAAVGPEQNVVSDLGVPEA